MALLNCAGAEVLTAEIRMPRVGVATADLVVNSETDLAGALTISTEDGAFSLKGTASRHGQFVKRQSLRWTAGADGLGKVIPPKQFLGYTLRTVLTNTLGACGETLSPASDSALLSSFLTSWTRLARPAKTALIELLEAKGASAWRVLPDGSVWVAKSEPWPAAPAKPFQVLDWNRSEGWALLGVEQPFMLPGTTIPMDDGSGNITIQRLSYVVHYVEPKSVRTKVWFEDA